MKNDCDIYYSLIAFVNQRRMAKANQNSDGVKKEINAQIDNLCSIYKVSKKDIVNMIDDSREGVKKHE